jgi:Domain of Unknown Function (DUF1080)
MRLFTVLFLGLLTLSAIAEERRFDFSETPEGALPTNFVAVLGGGGATPHWQIISADVPSEFSGFDTNVTVMTHAKVLAQSSDDMTDERFPICLFTGDTYRDFKFSTQFKIVSGISEQMAGIVFRFQNISNYYYVRISAMGKNLRFFKIVDGVRSEPIGVPLNLPAGEWHSLAVQCDGNQITVSLDGHVAMPVLGDNTFVEGKIGFWTKSDSVTYFARPAITYTPRIAPAKVVLDAVLAKYDRLPGFRLYKKNADGQGTHIIASSDPSEVGQAGSEDILGSMEANKPYYGRESGFGLVTMPVRDRNGDIIGAMRVKLKMALFESQDSAVTRATTIRKQVETLCPTEANLAE